MGTDQSRGDASHWQAYWRSPIAGAAVSGDAPGDLFDSLWQDFFDRTCTGRRALRLVDVACGAGVILDRAAAAAARAGVVATLTGLDYAPAAAAAIGKKPVGAHGSVYAVGGDARRLPFADHAFDAVVSQFGVEYAGVDAFAEAGRVLAPAGEGLILAHISGGGIDRECAGNFGVLQAIDRSGLFDGALAAYGVAGAAPPDHSVAAIEETLALLLGGEPLAAKQMLARLGPDVVRIVVRRDAFKPAEAIAWLRGMQQEVRLYAARMKSMNDAALDEAAVDAACARLRAAGVVVDAPEKLTPKGKPLPAAWRIAFRRRA